jgi:hypothetical protein
MASSLLLEQMNEHAALLFEGAEARDASRGGSQRYFELPQLRLSRWFEPPRNCGR